MGGIKLLQNETIPRLQKFPVVLCVPLFKWTPDTIVLSFIAEMPFSLKTSKHVLRCSGYAYLDKSLTLFLNSLVSL